MAIKQTVKKNTKSIEETLWDSADKLRGSVEPSEYKHVVLALIFLKFASDRFEHRRGELISERIRNDFGKEIAKAFEIIVKHPEWTAEQIAEESGKTPRTIENYLSKLKKAGIIKRTGPKLGGHWVVIDE